MTADERKVINARLERIRGKARGVLTPEDVVKDARSESSPLHGHFTWDDSQAAHMQRLHEARVLIRSVRVEVTTTSFGVATPFYVRDVTQPSGKQGYSAIAEVRDDATVAADTLTYEFDRVIACLERSVNVASGLNLRDRVRDLLRQAIDVYNSIPIAAKTTKASGKSKKTGRAKAAV